MIQDERTENKKMMLVQMKTYLDGEITKETYADIAENYYVENACYIKNTEFDKLFIELVADACEEYVNGPKLTREIKERLFHEEVMNAYKVLSKL